ncbi:hypothetical protein [Ligilactobacillus apodemi]|uniref:Lipoprotein SmpA/OmlA domain-containing protein n=1 Tax=Ligilactobacillus apodemi DSM 16634 = JCM 16172 TaxID=1423724 RepID=A0A0R1TQC0_9LACO|nr:hypothetical protein [Ligilactobacillus apodemi]KRL83631.1 hypothetical protein FC32_GL000889 [Ligilactobacillus apodemi DSM 16634 = JCM 16172]
MNFKRTLMLGLTCFSLGTVATITYQANFSQTIVKADTQSSSSSVPEVKTVSSKKFKKVKLGMSKRQVVDIIGQPTIDNYEDSLWTFSTSDGQVVSLYFSKDSLENITDSSLISTNNSVKKSTTKETKKSAVNKAFATYLKKVHEYAKAGQTEFSWSTMIKKITFDGDDEVKIQTQNGFAETSSTEKNDIAKKLAKISKSFLHRYNSSKFDLEFYYNNKEIGSNKGNSLTKFEWKSESDTDD